MKDNAILGLTSTGNLLLKNADGILGWFTNISAQDFQGMMIEETGNLVLLNSSNGTLWQSFDHPTDMFLHGQKFKVGQKLATNISPTNASQGIFYATLLFNGFALYTTPAPPQMYYRYPKLPTTLNVAYMQFDNESVGFYSEGLPSIPVSIPINSLTSRLLQMGMFCSIHSNRKLKCLFRTFCQALRVRYVYVTTQ